MPDISSRSLSSTRPPGFRLVCGAESLYLLRRHSLDGSTSFDTAKFFCRWSRSAPASIATRALSSRSSRSIRFRSLFRVSFIHAYLPAKPNTTTTPAVKRAFAQRGMTLSSSTLISTWENRGLLHAWTRFAAIRSACAGNEDAGKEGGIQSRFRGERCDRGHPAPRGR